jgi:hypothetical protein
MLGNLVGGFIVILVGAVLMPVVADQIASARENEVVGHSGTVNTTVSGTAGTLLGLTTIFFALAIASAGIAIAAQGLRSAGLLGR